MCAIRMRLGLGSLKELLIHVPQRLDTFHDSIMGGGSVCVEATRQWNTRNCGERRQSWLGKAAFSDEDMEAPKYEYGVSCLYNWIWAHITIRTRELTRPNKIIEIWRRSAARQEPNQRRIRRLTYSSGGPDTCNRVLVKENTLTSYYDAERSCQQFGRHYSKPGKQWWEKVESKPRIVNKRRARERRKIQVQERETEREIAIDDKLVIPCI